MVSRTCLESGLAEADKEPDRVADSVALPAQRRRRLNLKPDRRWQHLEMPEQDSKKAYLFSLGLQTL
jgi:hypothetical protein